MNPPRIIIVGAGFGGLELAKHLKGIKAQVVVIDLRNHFLFQPLLYQVATAGLSPSDIASPIRSILRHSENTEVLMERVVGVDAAQARVLLDGDTIKYDFLVLATGAQNGYFGHDQWEKFAPGLKSIHDATTIREKILLAFEAAEIEPDEEKRKALLTFVIIGAGPTGVELAGAISELSKRALASDFRHINPASAKIILIEAGPRILSAFPERLATAATLKLRAFGVDVITGLKVENVDSGGVFVSGKYIFAKTIIWAAGVIASPAGQWVGAEMDRMGRIRVDSFLRIPGHKNIFALGDTACFIQGGSPLPGVSPVAMQQGRYLARYLKSAVKAVPFEIPFRYHDKGNLATVGRSFAIVDLGKIKFSGFFAWVTWLVVHIYYLIGFRNRLIVLIQWAWAYLTFKAGARLVVREDLSRHRRS